MKSNTQYQVMQNMEIYKLWSYTEYEELFKTWSYTIYEKLFKIRRYTYEKLLVIAYENMI